MINNTLLQASDLLEKAAAYIEEIEDAKQKKEAEDHKKTANELAETVSTAVGEPVSNDLIEKLSKADPEVRALIGKIANADLIDPMGGPETEEKVASISDGMGSAEASLLNFLLT